VGKRIDESWLIGVILLLVVMGDWSRLGSWPSMSSKSVWSCDWIKTVWPEMVW